MAIELKGSCHCGDVQVRAELSKPASEFEPRKCDCSFCVKHGASYISDSGGGVHYQVKPEGKLTLYRQGPLGAADFASCAKCSVLVGVLYQTLDEKLFSTINSNIFDEPDFGNIVPASPQKLSQEERIQRWEKLWFSNVTIGSL